MTFFSSVKENHLRQKGQKLLTKGKVEKAYSIFQKVLLINDSAANLFNVSVTLMTLGKYPEAEKYLLKIHEKYPENELNTLSLAECKMMQKKWNEAIPLYEKIAAKNSKLEKYLNVAKDSIARKKYVKSKQLFNRATLALKNKNCEKAIQFLIEAEEYSPEDANILHNIGSIYFLTKKYKKAYQYISRAHSLDKNSSKYQKSLSKVKKKLKKTHFLNDENVQALKRKK